MKNKDFDTVVENLDFVFNTFKDRPALYINKEEISYDKLKNKTNILLNFFLKKGFRQGDICVIFNDKSLFGIASIIACIYLGVVFINLDHESPNERLEKIITKCSPKFTINLCCENQKYSRLITKFNIISIDKKDLSIQVNNNLTFKNKLMPQSPVYIMFTSGSTGFPKGAIINHKNLLNFIYWAQNRFKINQFDRLTNINPIYFDNSIFDLFASLLSGACLVPFSLNIVSKPLDLLKLLYSSKCTIWFSVPSLLIYLIRLRVLDKKYFVSVRSILFGGEGFPKKHLKYLYDLLGDQIILENVYGPTECTCICSSHRIVESDFDDMNKFASLGKLANHFTCHIEPIDFENANVGELILMGPSVGQGYINDFELSNKSFITKIDNKKIQGLGYRTGDIVRIDNEGNLHFVSRKDHQIKHMGYRIELGEIESALNLHKSIFESLVIYNKIDDYLGEIVAYVAGESNLNITEIITFLSSKIPKYMIPSKVKVLPKLPKNSNGKIDRNAF